MSVYLKKSGCNLKAAESLIKVDKNFIPSIHCAYYSSLQHIMHILYSVADWDYSMIKEECRKAEHGSHVTMLKIIKELILEKTNNHSLAIAVDTLFGQLKELRILSDYKEDDLSDAAWSSKSSTAKSLAIDLNGKLQKNIVERKK